MTEAGRTWRASKRNAKAHDLIAEIYDVKHNEIYNPVEQQRLSDAISDLVTLSGKARPSVLDVGAGTGNLSLKFLAASCELCAADVSVRSLARLVQKAPAGSRVSTHLITDECLPFPDATFDIVATYSVLHHIDDYLLTVREMIRVLRPGGLLYIDHEASARAWQMDPVLAEYRSLTKLGLWEHAWGLLRTGEAFSFAFLKTLFMKAFVNRRYEREGDIHVWPDDHIDWERITVILEDSGMTVIRSDEYLLYNPRGGEALYQRYRGRCADTLLLFARKEDNRDTKETADRVL